MADTHLTLAKRFGAVKLARLIITRTAACRFPVKRSLFKSRLIVFESQTSAFFYYLFIWPLSFGLCCTSQKWHLYTMH